AAWRSAGSSRRPRSSQSRFPMRFCRRCDRPAPPSPLLRLRRDIPHALRGQRQSKALSPTNRLFSLEATLSICGTESHFSILRASTTALEADRSITGRSDFRVVGGDNDAISYHYQIKVERSESLSRI